MKKGYSLLKLAAGLLMLAMLSPQLCHAAFTQILYLARYNKAPVFGTDTLGGVTYTTISYEDLMNSGAPGMPSLPVDYIRFSVPYNATNFTVTATPTSNQPHYIDHLLYPCQAPSMINDTTPAVITLPDSAAYYSGTTYPTQTAWVVDEGFLDGENHIVTVAVMPFHYVHTATSDLVAQKRMVSVKLKFDLSDTLAMYPIVRNDSLLREEGYRLTRSMVVNPNQVKTFAPSQITILQDSMGIAHGGIGGDGLNGFDPPTPSFPDPLGPPSIDTTGISTQEMHENDVHYPYLIVTTNELHHSLRRLVALKRQKGYNVKIVTMDDVMNAPFAQFGDRFRKSDGTYQVAFSDSAGVLRQFLKYYFVNYGTRYVLFAGSSIPFRKLYGEPAEIYFSDLNADWYRAKDCHPELFVGRIFAKSEEEVEYYTNKLLTYELNPGHGDDSYLNRSLFTEAHGFIGMLDRVRSTLNPVIPDEIIIREQDYCDYPKGCDVIDSINTRPIGFFCTFNHGDITNVVTYGYGGNSDKQYTQNVGKLYRIWAFDSMKSVTNDSEPYNGLNRIENITKPFIYYCPSCFTIPFDELQTSNDIGFGQSFTTGGLYGGPVFIGYTQRVETNDSKEMLLLFAKEIAKGNNRLGVADALSKSYYAGKSTGRAIMIHCFLGDPSVDLWRDCPGSFSDITVSRADSTITIRGIDSESTVIGYFNKNNTAFCLTINTDSVTLADASPNSPIMLYGNNSLPMIAPLILQNSTISKSQYVLAKSFIAGNSVDDNRTCGDVVVKKGSVYEIEASGDVQLEGGFSVEKGATLKIIPSQF